MFFKKCLLLLLFAIMGCSSPNRDKVQLKTFFGEWANLIKSKNEAVKQLYDPQFVFPKVIFQPADGLNYDFGLENLTATRNEDANDFHVTLPFTISSSKGEDVESGIIEFTISKTKTGFIIRDMSRQFAEKIIVFGVKTQTQNHPELTLKYDTILNRVQSLASSLSKQYDSVVFYTEVDKQTLFYVVNGEWKYPFEYKKQCDSGNYKMGVVTAENEVIIPILFTKIYNPNGSFEGMIEVEKGRARGLFRTDGKEFIPSKFDGIYPTKIPGAFAQVRKGQEYGWVDINGKVFFNESSHADKRLFQSPTENGEILGWELKYPGSIKILIEPYSTERNGIIIYPSFIKDLGITTIANTEVLVKSNQYGMGMEAAEIKIEKVEKISDKLFGLISFFMEAGVDARDYHTSQNDLVMVDNSLNKLSGLETMTSDYARQDPCGSGWQYRKIESGLYESKDDHGIYSYYKFTTEGNVEKLSTVRSFNFTKFAKIDESYFNKCHYESIDYKGTGTPNVVVIRGISFEDLDIMRNEIFAEYGFIFKSPKWKKYFESKHWYKPQYDNVDQFLTETDRYNIKFLLDYQRTNKNPTVKRDSILVPWAG